MFKIQDGRDSFTQWDYNRKLIVEDDSITQVHFTNLITNKALVCEVQNNLVDVPNILLQDYGYIVAYGFDKNYTKYTVIFNVIRRDKPDDYIYTETEILNYNKLLDRMNAVDENIEQSVKDYLQENPPTVDLEGYATEEYVDNALAAIPTADLSNYYTKPEANAKFATKEEIPSTSGLATEQFVNSKVSGLATENYVNSANSNVLQTISQNYALKSEIPSTAGLATEEYVDNAVTNISSSSGGVDVLEIIADVTIEKNCEKVIISEDSDGKPFELKKVIVELTSFKQNSNWSPAAGKTIKFNGLLKSDFSVNSMDYNADGYLYCFPSKPSTITTDTYNGYLFAKWELEICENGMMLGKGRTGILWQDADGVYYLPKGTIGGWEANRENYFTSRSLTDVGINTVELNFFYSSLPAGTHIVIKGIRM